MADFIYEYEDEKAIIVEYADNETAREENKLTASLTINKDRFPNATLEGAKEAIKEALNDG